MRSSRSRSCPIRTRWNTAAFRLAWWSFRRDERATCGRFASTVSIRRSAPSGTRTTRSPGSSQSIRAWKSADRSSGSAVSRADGSIPLQHRRSAEPSVGRAPHDELAQPVYPCRRRALTAAFARGHDRALPQGHDARLDWHVHAARCQRRRPRPCLSRCRYRAGVVVRWTAVGNDGAGQSVPGQA